MKEKNACFILIAVCMLAILVRALVFINAYRQNKIEVYEYETIAVNLIEGRGFLLPFLKTSYHSGIAPLYPFLCALIYILFGHKITYIIFLQIFLNVAICYLTFRIGTRIFNEKIGLLSSFLVCLHPSLIIYSSVKLHSLVVYTFLFCMLAHMILKTFDSTHLTNQIIMGVFFGLSILERPTILIFVPLFILWLFIYLKNKKSVLMIALRLTLIVAIILLPWFCRSVLVYRNPVFIQSNQWFGFWVGNNPCATGTLYLSSGKTVLEASPDEFKAKLYSLDESGQNDFFRASALEFIKSNPQMFLLLTCKKIFYFWWFSPQSGILYSAGWLQGYKIYYIGILLFALAGLINALISRQSRKFAILFIFIFASISISHSFYYVEGRHRWSIEPFILIFTSAGLAWTYENAIRYFKKSLLSQLASLRAKRSNLSDGIASALRASQ